MTFDRGAVRDAASGARERSMILHNAKTSMPATQNRAQNLAVLPHTMDTVSPAQEQALREAYKEMMGSTQDSYDVERRCTHLLPLRAARRAQTLRRPKADVVAYYMTVLAVVVAEYQSEDDRTLSEVGIAEQRANCDFDCVQMQLGPSPSVSQLLSADRSARRQIAATQTVREKIARLLRTVRS